MRNLEVEAKKVMEMLDAISIPYGNIVYWNVNNRAYRRWGHIKRLGTIHHKPYFSIDINASLLDERNSLNGLQSTIAHELLHSIDKCMNHGELWKRWAELVNDCYPHLHITTTDSAAGKGVVVDSVTPEYRFKIVCNDCNKEYLYRRKAWAISHIDCCRCSRCDSSNLTVINL